MSLLAFRSLRNFLATCFSVLLLCSGLAAQPTAVSPVDQIAEMNREVVHLYHVQGKYDEALALALETRELARRTVGEEHAGFADSLDNLAAIYQATGRYDQAEPLLREALEIWRRLRGEDSPDYVTSLNNLAGLCSATGRYAEAETYCRQSLEIVRSGAGEDNPFFVKTLNNLASLYKSMGNYVEVEPLYTKARDILLKISGENQPDYAIVLSNLGHLYYLTGRYLEAEPVYVKSLEITARVLGEQHPQYARTLINLGSLYEATGRYAKAEPRYQQARAILSSTVGPKAPAVATVLNNLAGLYQVMGDYGKAEACYQQANDIRRTAFGDKHPEYASGLNNIADLYYQMGRFEAAEPLYKEAVEIERASLGNQHPDVALAMQNLAVLYKTTGRYQEAEPLYRQALDIWKSTVGERHPDTALTIHNLAALYQAMGRYPEAETWYRQALAIRSSILGVDHPDVAVTLNNLASLCAATSREQEALELMHRAQAINDRLIQHVFAIASESQRLGYLAVLQGEMDAFLSLVAVYLPSSPAATASALDLVLRRKAMVAEALAAQRDAILGGHYPDLAPTLQRLRTWSVQIARKTMAGPGPEGIDAHRQALEKWNDEKERLEVQLASRIPAIELERRLMEADRRAVAKALPAGSALVEFIRYRSFDFKAVPARGDSPWKPARYLAFMVPAGQPESFRMIDLGEADPIDRLISDLRTEITGESEKSRGLLSAAPSPRKPFHEAAVRLREALFDPLVKGMGGCKRLFLAPDGDLYRLPFAVLPLDINRRVIDDYQISYVGTGRDILRFALDSRLPPAPALVIADPDYDLGDPSAAVPMAELGTSSEIARELMRKTSRFQRLPGTRAEGESIARMLAVKALEDKLATKRQLAAARSPRILHIATHGFFLPDRDPAPRLNTKSPGEAEDQADRNTNPLARAIENPLLRSGLVLAGANSWLQGKAPAPEADDGILTGEDASGLDLLATDLVVLSACETGLGDIRLGEGVFGLRRAFLLAGAKTLVMSLWKIPDEQTQVLMSSYYQRLLAGQPRAEALHDAQLAVKATHPEPLYWGAFISQGDPAPLPRRGPTK